MPEPGNDKPKEPKRDSRGRWLPGHCPNPKGRPKKKTEAIADGADLQHFKNTLVEVRTANGPERMTREAALLHKIFEDAMRGKVSMQKFLYQELERKSKQLADARGAYEKLIYKWVVNNPDIKKPDYELPDEIAALINEYRAMLSHYYPTQYEMPDFDDIDLEKNKLRSNETEET